MLLSTTNKIFCTYLNINALKTETGVMVNSVYSCSIRYYLEYSQLILFPITSLLVSTYYLVL